jgi:dienelactone hydrolase
LLDSPASAEANASIVPKPPDLTRTPVSDAVFSAFKGLYDYDHTELNARIERAESTVDWVREFVTFDAAYGHERIPAHVYVPRRSGPKQRFQAVVYVPGGFAVQDAQLDLNRLESSLGFLVKSGRVLVAPIYKGTYERRYDSWAPVQQPALFRDHVILIAKDLRRTLDYLETRQDIDATRLGYLGLSFGAQLAPVFLAIEPRFEAAVLESGGLMLRHDLPEVERFNFAPHVHIPVLMLNGRFDTSFPLESAQRPLFKLLGTADKKHVIYEGGHADAPQKDRIREILSWFDRHLGLPQ